MIQNVRVKGIVSAGIGRGESFFRMDWVSSGIKELLGFDPYPGTLNLKIDEKDFAMLNELLQEGLTLKSPSSEFCTAILLRATIKGVQCAAIFPEKSVWVHRNTLEIIAPFRLKGKLSVEEGSEIEVDIKRRFVPQAVIFDMDGTLVDSFPLFSRLVEKFLKERSIPCTSSSLREAINENENFWEVLLPEEEGVKEKVIKEAEEFFRFHLHSCDVFPQAKDVIQKIRERGIKTALIGTDWDLKTTKSLFKKAGIEIGSFFDYTFTDLPYHERRKSLKESLIGAFSALSASPYRTVYVGDRVLDIRTGKELGLVTVGVLTGVGEREELYEAGADHVIGDLEELVERIDETC